MGARAGNRMGARVRRGPEEDRMMAWRRVMPAPFLALILALAVATPAAAQMVARPLPRQTQATTAPVQQPTSATAVVPANGGWIRTGLALKRGERLQIDAQGRWSAGAALSAAVPSAGPGGFANQRTPTALLPGAPVGALIARVGDTGRPFVVGASFSGVSPADGPLYLAFNDDPAALKDNTGRISATIAVTAAAPAGQTQPVPQGARPSRPSIPQVITDALKQLQQPAQPTRPPAGQAPTTGAGADKPPVTQPPATQAPPQTTQPPSRTPVSGSRPPVSRPPDKPPADQAPPDAKPPGPETPTEPAIPPVVEQAPPPATDTPATPVEQTGPPPDVAPPQAAPPPVKPAAPFNPLLLLIGAGVVALGVLLLAARAFGRGQRSEEPEHPAGAPRVSAQLSADGRSGQALTVKWRRRS